MSESLRIIFAGTPDFAARHLDALLSSGHNVVGVFTQPDRPAGRGKKLMPSPVKVLAEEKALPVFQPVSLRPQENQQLVADLQADVMVVVAYGLILPKAVLEMPRLGCINVHGSLLPRWRGAAPIQRSLWAGDAETGVTIWIGNVLGPILAKTNDLTLCIILAIVGLLLTNVLNNNAVIILLSTAVVTLSVQGFIGDPIIPIIVVICSAEMGFITPAASIYGALIHAHKYVTPSSAYKYGAIMMVFSLLFLFLIVIPLTKLLF